MTDTDLLFHTEITFPFEVVSPISGPRRDSISPSERRNLLSGVMQPERARMQMWHRRQLGLPNPQHDEPRGTPFDLLFGFQIGFTSPACPPYLASAYTTIPLLPSTNLHLLTLSILFLQLVKKKKILIYSDFFFHLSGTREHKSPRVPQCGDTYFVGVSGSRWGGQRSRRRGSDKLWNVKDQFLPHVLALWEHSRAVSRHHV